MLKQGRLKQNVCTFKAATPSNHIRKIPMYRNLKKILAGTLLSAFILTPSLPIYARPVQDINGKKIELADQVNRIADLWHANNQVVLLLGGGDKLVATTDIIRNNPWFAEVFPKIKTVPALTNGQGVQMEALLAVRPDAVLVSSPRHSTAGAKSRHEGGIGYFPRL